MEKNIYTKLLEFQRKGISIKKGSQNPHFKNKYADINEILDKVKKPLNDMGVVIIQCPTIDGLETTLYDTDSATSVTGLLPFIQKQDAQKLGSNITYNRRYSLVSMLGLEDHDDDGNRASEPEMGLDEAFAYLSGSDTVDELNKRYKAISAQLQRDPEIIAKCKELKEELID